MKEKLKQLKILLAEKDDLEKIADLLEWDQQVYMPHGGAEARGNQMGTIQRLAHEKLTSPIVASLLAELTEYAKSIDQDSDDARLIKIANRDFETAVKVPADFVAEFSKVKTLAHGVWVEARAAENFSIFQPSLEKIVDMVRRYAEFFAPYEHVYDPLLDIYEPGMKTRDVRAIFETLRPQQVKLLNTIKNSPQVENGFLYQPYDIQKQWDFGVEVATIFGYDWNRGRQDKSAHPFTTAFSINDVRITTRFDPDYIGSALFSTLHEGGHALYEQGVSQNYERTSLAGGVSLAIHESQSRMFENLIGLSQHFWSQFFPRLQEFFPSQLRSVDLDTFYKGINKVEPSLIRVEADEATYNLHVMLRLEIEIALLEGKLEVKDLPEAWNNRMQDYLGITPPNDAQGVLQDVHWSSGLFGYFSTYALGNLVSAQLWEVMEKDMPGMHEQISRGKFGDILDWVRTRVHVHGRKFDPQELVQQITGSKIDPAAYMRYLTSKFSQIYNF
ncbi:MAG: carboxypeptidase M32 [Anaerolineae bacterium]|nr:carboxypeptidase M32 [Anaerolineae bacterium]